jgi:tetratricopeptide (TPR) repeat protein
MPTIALVVAFAIATAVLAPATQVLARDSALNTISARDRELARQHYRLGMEAMRDESWEKAADEFRAAIKLDRLFVMAHYGLGQTQMALQNYAAALQAFLACRAAHSELAALQQSDLALADQRRDDEIRELKEGIRIFQREADIRAAGGAAKALSPQNSVLRLESRLHQLEMEKGKGLYTAETPAEFSLAIGSAYFRSGKIEAAEQAYREAVKANSKMGEAHNNLAVVYLMQGRLRDAESEMKAAEKSGFAVNPRFKDDLRKAKEAAPLR